MTDHENEPDLIISFRRQPAGPSIGNPEDDTGMYEVICRLCGDDPALDYQEVPAELRQIRGPYPSKAGIAAFSSTTSSTTEPRRRKPSHLVRE